MKQHEINPIQVKVKLKSKSIYAAQQTPKVGAVAYLLTSKKSRAPPVPSRWAEMPVKMRDSSGLKQQPVSECVVGSPVKTCTGVFSLRRSHICRTDEEFFTRGW